MISLLQCQDSIFDNLSYPLDETHAEKVLTILLGRCGCLIIAGCLTGRG